MKERKCVRMRGEDSKGRGRQQGEGKEAERDRERGRNAVVVNQMSSDSIH